MANFDFLPGVKTIAIVGLSDKPEKPSYQVAEYLISKGYRIIPVNPNITMAFGEKAFSSLNEIPQTVKIDLVDIFRKSEEVFQIVKNAIARGIKHIWMQEGVKNVEAIKYAEEHGATVAADICLMKTLKNPPVSAKQLQLLSTQILTPSVPFNFDATFFKPDHFTTDDHYYEKGMRWQTIRWAGKSYGIVFSNKSNLTEQPEVELEIWGEVMPKEIELEGMLTELRYRYNFDLDLQTVYQHLAKFTELQGPIRNLYGMRPGHPSSLYEYVIIGIVLQNAAVRRSISMFKTLLSDYGEKVTFAGKELLCIFDPGRFKDVPEEELRAKKFGYRAKSIRRVDEQFASGGYDEFKMRELSVEGQKKQLLSLYGIGPATVWYLLFDIFHRWDIFEHISPWEQKLYSQLFFSKDLDHLVPVGRLLSHISRYKEYKQLAVHYLWEDLWWRRYNGEKIEWLEKEIRV